VHKRFDNPIRHLNALLRFAERVGLSGPAGGRAAHLLQAVAAAAEIWPGDGKESHSVQTTTNSSQTWTRSAKLLDADAEACEQLLQRHIDRLESARSGGWWRCSIFVAADGDGSLEAVTSALRGICSGEATALDPIQALRITPSVIRSAMVCGQTLRLLPVGGAQGHPLGEPFDALATCVTSGELAIVTGLPRRDVPGVPMREVAEFALSALAPPGQRCRWVSCEIRPDARCSRRR